MNHIYNIFVDMDGVLVDFNKGYFDLTGVDIRGEFHTGDYFWDPINKAGYNFWVNLPWKKDGKKLWNYIEKYKPKILSAPSRENDSRIGKIDWVKRELPGVEIILRTPKYKKEFASPDSILIDDRSENVEDWIKSSGIGILHTDTITTIKILNKLGL